MRIALATCSDLPSHEHDDAPLHAALRSRGVVVEQPIWDDREVEWTRFDAVLIRTTWDYQSKHQAFVAWAERVAEQTRLYNPAPIVRWNTDKLYLRELEALGVPLAQTQWFERGRAHDLRGAVRGAGIVRGFIKPVIGANACGTLRFDARQPDQLDAAVAHLDRLVVDGGVMLQPYLASVEREGELSAIYLDGVLSHAVRKIPRGPAGRVRALGEGGPYEFECDYRVQDDFGASDRPTPLDDEALALGERTLAGLREVAARRGWDVALPLVYARVDMLRDNHGALVLNELEVVEPSLFFRHGPRAADRLATALLERLG
jgi:hypothetical protein